jgi:hypothetical protein
MSRRRGEFEHRTSIFEGAFRAWSHLGGLAPEDVESKQTNEIDPLTYPVENDPRLASQRKSGELKESAANPDGSTRREYPYEPLPRSGLGHPYVQAILSPYVYIYIVYSLYSLCVWRGRSQPPSAGRCVCVCVSFQRIFFSHASMYYLLTNLQVARTRRGQ